MVSERAFATEAADVQQIEIAPEYIGEEAEVAVAAEVQESAGTAEASVEDEEVVDLEAVLGGGIRKAPSAAVEPEADAEPVHAEATA
jgi:small subunit ribosomal protein S2